MNAGKEHKMGLWQGIRLYPKAILWAGLISLCCAMEGYDIALIGNFYAFPPFNRKYGELQPDGSYQVPARWQSGISNGAQCGQIVGLLRMCRPPILTCTILTLWQSLDMQSKRLVFADLSSVFSSTSPLSRQSSSLRPASSFSCWENAWLEWLSVYSCQV